MTAKKAKAPAKKKPAKKASKKAVEKPAVVSRPAYPPIRPTPKALRATERLRKLCLALPEVTERVSHGEATWFVQGKKSFVMMSDHHHNDRVAVTCAGADGAQEVLVATQPDKFYRPPYVGHLGWLGIYLDVPGVDWDQIADLIVEAYRRVAPQKLIDRL